MTKNTIIICIYRYIRTYIPWLSSAYKPTIFLTFDYMHGYAMCVFFHGHICSAILSVFLTVGPCQYPQGRWSKGSWSTCWLQWWTAPMRRTRPVVRQTGWPICGAQFMVKVWFSSQDFGWPVFRHIHLVGGLEHVLFLHILGMIISTDW